MPSSAPPSAPQRLSYRAIGPADRRALADLFERLSDRSRRLRFMGPKASLSERDLTYFTEVDHRRHEAIVAVEPGGRLAGVARYASVPGQDERVANVAFAVADGWQGSGVGTELGRRVVEHARGSGIERLRGTTLATNAPARRLLRRLGFTPLGASIAGIEFELSLAAVSRAA